MSNEKRLFLFLLLTFGSIWGIQYLMDVTGLNPPPRKLPPVAKAKDDVPVEPLEKETAKAKEPGKPAEAVAGKDEGKAQPPRKQVAEVKPDELVIGSALDHSPNGYRLEVRLQQVGAGVVEVLSSRYEAEFDDQPPAAGQRRKPRHLPLKLLDEKYNRKAFPSLAITLPVLGNRAEATGPDAAEAEAGKDKEAETDRDAQAAGIARRGEIPLDLVVWEVVRDEQGRVAQPIPAGARSEAEETGRVIVFRTTVGQPELVVTKTYRLNKRADGFEIELRFDSPDEERNLVYKLLGPHGIPIEGEWYTGTFRDVFFGQIKGNDVEVVTRAASDIAKKPETFQALPLKFAGIENQYFAVFVAPSILPKTPEDRWDSEAVAAVVPPVPADASKADVTVELTSKPFKVGPNVPLIHTYKVFAGPKTAEALGPYGATALASYRKNQWFGIPGSAWMATTVITPLLDVMYNFTARVARLFGGKGGNYGIAIILLTLTVRMMMFPIGRKQAMAAKKMQDLQPLLKELQEKYKDDKEQQTRETWALYKKHKVNPLGGCLPALIQLPIFVGLWQALNNSVHLRHARFLWIENLAAPDMLFRFPFEGGLPLLGQYLNLLPFLVVTLMLIQTKLFSPPATTPEMEQQQKMMKYMMIFMAFMFYKVPSGLGIYFITSSLWQIGERLLLPKVTHSTPLATSGPDEGGRKGGPGAGGGNGAPDKPPGKIAQFWEKILSEASKNPTYRNLTAGEQEPERDRGKPRRDPAGGGEDVFARSSIPYAPRGTAVLSLDPTDTIAAISSPPGAGFRGLVRLSGPDAWVIALRGFEPDIPAPLPTRAERRAGRLRVEGLRPLLPAAIALWPGPRTSTGQPLAEIHTIGATPLVELILAQCLARGARHAAPGEFTLRAFLSGRLDLTRSEAVLGVIDARTPAQLDAALQQLAGGLAGPIVGLRDRLLDVLAHLEAGLDFVDEADVDPLGRAALAASLAGAGAEVVALAERLRGRDRPEGHPRVVLVGPPNAGKSRLFNALLGREHAIVSPHAGTTRDYLSALCDCAGVTVELIDTAGAQSATSAIEARAQDLRSDQVAQADLLLACRSADTNLAGEESLSISLDRPRLDVWTKADLAPPEWLRDVLPTSAATGAGLAALCTAIASALHAHPAEDDIPAGTAARCRASLVRASQALDGASETLLRGGGDELVAIDLRQALDELGKVVGAVVTDDILDRIFRRFCIGK